MPRKKNTFTTKANPTAARVAVRTNEQYTQQRAIDAGKAMAAKMAADVPAEFLAMAIHEFRAEMLRMIQTRGKDLSEQLRFVDAGVRSLHMEIDPAAK